MVVLGLNGLCAANAKVASLHAEGEMSGDRSQPPKLSCISATSDARNSLVRESDRERERERERAATMPMPHMTPSPVHGLRYWLSNEAMPISNTPSGACKNPFHERCGAHVPSCVSTLVGFASSAHSRLLNASLAKKDMTTGG